MGGATSRTRQWEHDLVKGRGVRTEAGNNDGEIEEFQRKEQARVEQERLKMMRIVRKHSQMKAEILNMEFKRNLDQGGDAVEAAKRAEAAATKAGEKMGHEDDEMNRQFVQEAHKTAGPEIGAQVTQTHSMPGQQQARRASEKTFVYLHTYLKLHCSSGTSISGEPDDITRVLAEAVATVPTQIGLQRSEFSIDVSRVVVRCGDGDRLDTVEGKLLPDEDEIEEISLNESPQCGPNQAPTWLTCKASLQFFTFDAMTATQLLEEMHRFVGFRLKGKADGQEQELQKVKADWEDTPRRCGPICSAIRRQTEKLQLPCVLDFDAVAKAKVKLVGMRATSGYNIDADE